MYPFIVFCILCWSGVVLVCVSIPSGLVLFGFVWFGMVWFGLVWFGLVWFRLRRIVSGLVWF